MTELDLETRIEMAVIGLATVNKMLLEIELKIMKLENDIKGWTK